MKQEWLKIKIDPHVQALMDLRDEVLKELDEWEHKDSLPVSLRIKELAEDAREPKNEFEQYDENTGQQTEHTLLELAREFVQLEKECNMLELMMKSRAKQLAAIGGGIDTPLMAAWINANCGGLTIDGRVLSITNEKWLLKKKDVETKDAVRALKRAKLGVLVNETYHAGQLRSWLNDRIKAKKKIPPGVEKFFYVDDRRRFKTTKQKKKG